MKAYVIYLPSHEHSVSHSAYMLETLKSYGLAAELFEGFPGDQAVALANKSKKTLYPYSIKTKELALSEVKELIRPELYDNFVKEYYYKIIQRQPIRENHIGKFSRPGVIGCFYSHYHLWKKCVELGEPIMIFEDDVKFYRGWTPVSWDGVLILSLGKSSFLSGPQKTYLEDPSGLPMAVNWKNYSMPGASGYAITPNAAQILVKFYKPYWYPADNAINKSLVSMHIHNYIMGRNTIKDEGNVSMTKSKEWSESNSLSDQDYTDDFSTTWEDQ
jgi:GR25 family glycosyltransferase involved in LPS biosynthesis